MPIAVYAALFAANVVVLVVLISYGFTQTRKEIHALHLEMYREFMTIRGVVEAMCNTLESIDDEDNNDENDDTEPPIDHIKLAYGGIA
jgi:hypothetical protein